MKKTVCIWLIAALLLLGVSCTQETTKQPTDTVVTASGDDIERILLLGCDRAASLTDSIMIVAVDKTAGQASILQIPRDTYAEYTDRDYKKLNGAMGALGVENFKLFLEEVLDVDIDCYLSLRSDAIAGIVDAIGGVDINVPQDMDYSDPTQGLEIHLKAGQTHLDGAAAEQFVRYRSGYVNADLGRLDAQKLFLQAFADKCKSLSAAQSVSVMLRLMTAVQTDMPVQDAVSLIGTLRACEGDLRMETLPGVAVQGNSGAWYYAVNREGGERAVRECLFAPDANLDPEKKLDREQNAFFHEIYNAKESMLPMLEERAQKPK